MMRSMSSAPNPIDHLVQRLACLILSLKPVEFPLSPSNFAIIVCIRPINAQGAQQLIVASMLTMYHLWLFLLSSCNIKVELRDNG